ncbi:MAG: PKD domain-containing protein [Halapricum sp.]
MNLRTRTDEDDGEYEQLSEAYSDAAEGDMIELGDGDYSMSPTTVREGPYGPYATVEKAGITLVGSGKERTRVVFDTDERVLALPDWQCIDLAVDAADSVVGPRSDTLRSCRIESPIMDPVAYTGQSHQTGDGTAFAYSGLPPTASTAETYHGLSFDRVLNGVTDLGFDNTGMEPIDEAFREVYESNVLVELPPGEYLVDSEHIGSDVSEFGLRGLGATRRDVTIKPTAGSKLKWLKAVGSGPHLIENLSFDERSDDISQLSLWLTTSDGSVMKNVEWVGRTPDDSGVSYSLTAEVTERDGVFVIDGIYAGLDEPAVQVEYPQGVSFLRCGPSHVGEIILRDPVIHERNSAATRATAPTGVLTIEGGEFVNNQNANIRFGAGDHPSKVSSATGCYVRVDGSRNSTDAIRVEGDRYTGAVFRDIEIEWTKQSGRGVITFPDYATHGSAEFYDCVVRNDGEETLTVNAASSSGPDDSVLFENCSFTGSGRGFYADNRDGSEIRDSCIDMPNGSIRGFETVNTARSECSRPQEPPNVTPTITANKSEETTVDFSAVDSTYLDGDVTSYTWELDDTTETGETVSRTFPDAGTYSVTLTIEYDDGETTSTTAELIVNYPRLI